MTPNVEATGKTAKQLGQQSLAVNGVNGYATNKTSSCEIQVVIIRLLNINVKIIAKDLHFESVVQIRSEIHTVL